MPNQSTTPKREQPRGGGQRSPEQLRLPIEHAPPKVRQHGYSDAHSRPLVGQTRRGRIVASFRTSPERAWRYRYLELNPANAASVLVFDCDDSERLLEVFPPWIEPGLLPEPNWRNYNTSSWRAHVVYCLRGAVHRNLRSRRKPQILLAAVAKHYAGVLNADDGYAGILSRNPMARPHRGAGADDVGLPRGVHAAGAGRRGGDRAGGAAAAGRAGADGGEAGAAGGGGDQRAVHGADGPAGDELDREERGEVPGRMDRGGALLRARFGGAGGPGAAVGRVAAQEDGGPGRRNYRGAAVHRGHAPASGRGIRAASCDDRAHPQAGRNVERAPARAEHVRSIKRRMSDSSRITPDGRGNGARISRRRNLGARTYTDSPAPAGPSAAGTRPALSASEPVRFILPPPGSVYLPHVLGPGTVWGARGGRNEVAGGDKSPSEFFPEFSGEIGRIYALI